MKKVLIAVLVLALVSAGGAYWYVNDRARTLVDARLADMVESGTYSSAEYETLRVSPTGSINMKNLTVVQGPFQYTLRDISLTNLDYANPLPHHFDLAVDGLHIAASDNAPSNPADTALAGILQNLPAGEDIPMQLTYTHRYDAANAHQIDSTMRLVAPELFSLDASSTTRNIELETFDALDNADPLIAEQQLMALLQVVELPSMSMTLQDHGLVDDMLAASAAQNGVSPDDFRRLLVSQAQNFYLFLPQNAQPFAMAAGAEIAQFLEGGKTLTVSVNPEYGGSFQRLQQEAMGAFLTGDYGKISELLHLQIETN